MTPYASVALIKRGNAIVFKPPRKERPTTPTQARKAASRFWRGSLDEGDTLAKIFVVREFAGRLEIAEQTHGLTGWTQYITASPDAAKHSHLAACMKELGIEPSAALPPVPDVLEINGFIYRRDI
jgi:hypothetical protein